MAKKSSGADAAKEAARLASAGRKAKDDGGEKTKKPKRDSRRFLSFTSIVVLILILGITLVVVARITRDVAARPRQNEDHWHSAYAVWDCAANNGAGRFEPVFQSTDDEVGIHSHQDGVIHIHPWFDSASGQNARLEHFLVAMRVEITEEQISLPDGRILQAGVECDGEPSEITVRRWIDINQLDRDPIIYTEDFNDVRLFNDGQALVIARAAPGADVPPPPTAHINNTLGSSPQLQSRPPLEPANADGTATEEPAG